MDETELEAIRNDVILRSDIEAVIDATAARTAQAVLNQITPEKVENESEASNGQGAEVRNLIQCFDRVEDGLHVLQCRAGISKRQRKRRAPEIHALTIVRRTLLHRLGELGVRPMAEVEKVDYRLHEPVGKSPTSDPAKDGLIDEIVRTGFVRNERVVRSQQVIVFKHTPPREKPVKAANQ